MQLVISETKIQTTVCQYLKTKYPQIIFISEQGGLYASNKLAKQIAGQRSSKGLPDLILLEPRKGFHGACIEIKKHRSQVYNKNGGLKKNAHIQQQFEILSRLSFRNYFAQFSFGLDHTIQMIEDYLSNKGFLHI